MRLHTDLRLAVLVLELWSVAVSSPRRGSLEVARRVKRGRQGRGGGGGVNFVAGSWPPSGLWKRFTTALSPTSASPSVLMHK